MPNTKPIGIAYSDPDLTQLNLNGTAVSADAGELNKLDGATWTTVQLNQITDAFGTVTLSRATKIVRVALAAVRTAGGVLSWVNPEAGAILVTRIVLDITTQSTGASTIDCGYTAASATTLSDDAIDGLSGATAGTFDNIENLGTNGKSVLKVATGKWITASEASGDVTGLAGYAYIHYNNI